MSITLRIIFALAFATSVSANAEKALPEDVIKVGYLYHFGQLTRWPDEALNGHISFCIYGDQGLGRALTELDGKAIAGRNIEISHLEKFESAKDCHVLFVRNSDLNRARLIVSSVSQLPILTVTDDERLVDAEGGSGYTY